MKARSNFLKPRDIEFADVLETGLTVSSFHALLTRARHFYATYMLTERVSKNLGFSCMRLLRLSWTRYLITAVDSLSYISLTCSNWLIIRIQFINDSWRWLQYLLFPQRLWAISTCSQHSVAWALHSFNFILGIKMLFVFATEELVLSVYRNGPFFY